MTHHRDPTEHEQSDERREEAAGERFERPDLTGPRGNQDVEEIDVERGREKISRISGN
jgi:hypothetical protein